MGTSPAAVMTDWALNNFGDISKDWRENPDIRVDPKGVAMVRSSV